MGEKQEASFDLVDAQTVLQHSGIYQQNVVIRLGACVTEIIVLDNRTVEMQRQPMIWNPEKLLKTLKPNYLKVKTDKKLLKTLKPILEGTRSRVNDCGKQDSFLCTSATLSL
jgi:phytoene dehydrogenase-like protein